MPAQVLYGDVLINGSLSVTGSIIPATTRALLAQESYCKFGIPIENLRIWDSAIYAPIATAAADDLGFGIGAFATGVPYVSGGDVKTLTTTRYARGRFQMPTEYVSGQAAKIICNAGMITTVAATSCALDLVAYKVGANGLISGVDLVSSAAVAINSLVFVDAEFTLTPTTLIAGNWIDFRLDISSVDAATGTAVIPAIATIDLACHIKG